MVHNPINSQALVKILTIIMIFHLDIVRVKCDSGVWNAITIHEQLSQQIWYNTSYRLTTYRKLSFDFIMF